MTTRNTVLLLLLLGVLGNVQSALILPNSIDIDMSLYPKMPQINVNNATAYVIQGTFDCAEESFPSINEPESSVLIVDGPILCYPSRISEIALQVGYSGVLVVDTTSSYEMKLINFWNRQSYDIPVYTTRREGIQWESVQRIWLEDSDINSIFVTSTFFQHYTANIALLVIFSLWKLYKAIKTLSTYLKKKENETLHCEPKSEITNGMIALIAECFASILVLISCIDLNGIRGIYPWGVQTMMYRLPIIVSYFSTLVIWDFTIEEDKVNATFEETTSFERLQKGFRVIFVLYTLLEIATILSTIIIGSIRIVPSFALLLLLSQTVFFAFSFIRYFVHVLVGTHEELDLPRVKKQRKKLAFAAFFLLISLIVVVLDNVSEHNNVPELIVWYTQFIYTFLHVAIGLCKVLSVPEEEHYVEPIELIKKSSPKFTITLSAKTSGTL